MFTTFNTNIFTYERNCSTWNLRWYSFFKKKILTNRKMKSTNTGIENTTVPNTDNYDSVSEQDMIVESPVGFFFDMEHDDKSFSDIFSKSSIETNDMSINTMA